MSAMTPEEAPKPDPMQYDAEKIAEAVALMVERNAVTISKATALAHKRHAGLAIHYHQDGHIECLVTHTVATGETEHYAVIGYKHRGPNELLRVEIEDDRDDEG